MADAVLVAATVTSGLLAGAFLLYAHTVMPALARVGDAEFVRIFAALDRAIVNPVFMLTSFLGAPVLTAVALVLQWEDDACPWIAAALLLHLAMIGITAGVHLPRNDALKAAANLTSTDPAKTRAQFGERVWVRWNVVRVLLSATAFGLLAGALLEV